MITRYKTRPSPHQEDAVAHNKAMLHALCTFNRMQTNLHKAGARLLDQPELIYTAAEHGIVIAEFTFKYMGKNVRCGMRITDSGHVLHCESNIDTFFVG